MNENKRLNREHQTVEKMIALYCRAHHTLHDDHLCQACQALSDYAHRRIDRCPFGVQKPTCAQCPVHCYQPDQREAIRQVMRFAGPRMLLHHPVLAILHLFDRFRKPPTR
jgi:hypothetical protein